MGPAEIPKFLAALGENITMEAFEPKRSSPWEKKSSRTFGSPSP